MKTRIVATTFHAVAMVALCLTPPATRTADGQTVRNAPVREARELLRLGDAVEVPDWLTFVSEPRLMLDGAGRLFVVPGRDPRVRVLNQDGDFIRYIGGSGTGPGEFASLYRAGFAGDTLWIQDQFAMRTSFFDTAGIHVRTEANTGRPEMGSGYARKMPLAGGRQLVVGPPGEAAGGERTRMAVAIGPRDGPGRDTVASVLESSSMEIEGVGSFAHRLVVAPPRHTRLPDGTGVLVVDWAIDVPDRLTLRRYDLDGRPAGESTLDFKLREIPDDVREAYIDEGVAMVKRTAESLPETVGEQVPANLRGAVIQGSIIPDHYPPIESFFVTRSGQVWLRVATSENDRSEWVVIGADGSPEFRVSAPPGVTFKAADGDRVWGTGTTNLDIPYIGLYDLITPEGR
ncbi:MAG: hypothetical protein J4G12_08140 [Gemmatimonadetes bacterium]|nr:hypothetical protein [Gemmatimonadota bacterium]